MDSRIQGFNDSKVLRYPSCGNGTLYGTYIFAHTFLYAPFLSDKDIFDDVSVFAQVSRSRTFGRPPVCMKLRIVQAIHSLAQRTLSIKS